MALRVKLLARGKSLKPYIGSVSTNGRVQQAFREQIGKPVGACVRANVHKGMAQSDIRKAVADCAKQNGRKSLSL